MNIVFDHQAFSMQRFGGVSKYFVSLIDIFKGQHNVALPFYYSKNHYLNSRYFFINPFPDMPFKGKYQLEQLLIKKNSQKCLNHVRNNKVDIFHPTFYNNYYLAEEISCPLVLTVHDMIHEKHPDCFKGNASYNQHIIEKKFSIKRADHIIAISQTTKNDLVAILNIKPEKISVVYHGSAVKKCYLNTVKIPKPYILWVGTRSSYKNFSSFFMAYQIIAKRHPTINLLCLGPQANPFELQSITQAGLRDKVYFQQPPDKHLDAYYKNAMCYVSSSLDEGFGLPILEAFRNYTPTILSDIPIYREIADDCALYFNPLSPQSISACIEDILFDKQKCKKIIAIGAERSKTFCIENCATNTLNAYRNTM